jgi:S1-C subfamily serine protease
LALASLPPSKGFETEISSVSPEVAVESAASATDLDGFLRSVVTLNTSTGSGSGFFVNATGAIVTNDHVVGTDLAVEVVTAGGDVFLGRVVARSAVHDLALVQIDSDQTPFLRLGTARGTRVGSRVFAMGSPSGLTGSASGGIVSAIRNLDFGLAVQTDAAINPGNSGGPLVTEDGVVIGVSTSFLKETQGIGFAVAAEVVRQVFEGQF